MNEKFSRYDTLYVLTKNPIGTWAVCGCGCQSYTENGNRVCPHCGGNLDETTDFNLCDVEDNVPLKDLVEVIENGENFMCFSVTYVD